jgi:2-methylcitrate dehydratase PrpD
MAEMSHTAAILAFAVAPHRLSNEVRGHAQRLLADTLAVGAAGARSPEAAKVRTALAETGSRRDVRCLDGTRASWATAAFRNGFAIHCLEWDAVHESAVVHALSTVTAALLAASDRMGGSDPEAFLTALVVGVDIASGLGLSAVGPMRFFRPATTGVIAAALAVARLEGLPADLFADALGFAYSFASGTMQAHVEASVALPLQIARAAEAAVRAVDLAKAGLVAPHEGLEGPFGYEALIEPLDLARYTQGLGSTWRIADVSVKPFPSGRASHGALGALQALRAEGQVDHETVAAIELFAPPLIHRLVGRPYQPSAAASHNRLCLAFLAPLMLRDGHIDPRIAHSLPALTSQVKVTLDGNPDVNALTPQRLLVHLRDGTVIDQPIPHTLGSPEAPLSSAQAAAKIDLCRELAGNCDPRIFSDPLAYATDPR